MVMLTREEAGTARGAVRATGRGRLPLLMAALALLIAGLGLYSLMIGTPRLSPAQLWEVLVEGGGTRLARVAVLRLRLPRLALGILAGAMLALAGVLLQDALRNPIAGPELLGVSAGAAAIVAAVVIFQLPVPFALVPWLALAGGLLSGGLVILAARRLTDPIRLALIGAALTALLNALVTAIISLGAQNEVGLFFLFLLGSLANRGWDQVRIVLPWAVVGLPLALLCARPLNLLGLGDEVAAGLGLPVLRTRLLLLLLAAGLTAAVVAVCGPVAFVALLAPHLARRLLGTADARLTLPLAALVGAALLLAADVAGRQSFAPRELPVGMWTTIVGAPLLLALLRRQLGGGVR
jgi:iron complex transport system permease protein